MAGVALLAQACGSGGALPADASNDMPPADASLDDGPADAGPQIIMPAGTSLFIQVLDTAGAPVATAAVTLGGEVRTTDGAGRLLLEELTPGQVAARIAAPGHASASVAVELAPDSHAGIEVRLHPLGPPVPFDAAQGAELERGPVRVRIPPGALVDIDGQPVSGTVEATMVPLDPTAASPAEVPGPLDRAVDAGGAGVSLDSLVMAEVSLWQDGWPVSLAPGATATLELVVPDSLAGSLMVGQGIPAWWLDEPAATWRADGEGVIVMATSDPGRLAWVAEIGHLTWWNADRPWTEKSCFVVTVDDTGSMPVPGVMVGAQGVSYAGNSTPRYTDPDGQACVDIQLGGMSNLVIGSWESPLAPVAPVTGSGPASDCAGQGAACTPVQITVPAGTIVCTPGASIRCSYTGPAATDGVGLCRASTRYCNADGTGFSACIGEVLPGVESCAAIFDEDCDGEANEADGLGCECVAGETSQCYSGPAGTVDIGSCRAGVRTCNGATGQFGPCVGEVLPAVETCATIEDDDCNGLTECSGLALWSRGFGGPGLQETTGVAVDDTGHIAIAGSLMGSLDFGDGPLVSAGMRDIFVARLDPAGDHLWSRHYGDADAQDARAVAIDAAGNVLVTGYFYGTLDFGGGPLTATSQDVFLAKLDASGNHVWSRRYGNADTGHAAASAAIDVDAAGNVVLAGDFSGTVDFGGGPLTAMDTNIVSRDIFVVKLDAVGAHLWSRRFGDDSAQSASSITVDAAGNVMIVGAFSGAVDFGGGPLTAVGSTNLFVVKLTAGGSHVWSRRYGDGTGTYAASIAVDAAGNVLMVGHFRGTVNFGGGPLTSAGGEDVFVVKLDSAGNHLWSRRYGESLAQGANAASADAAGNIVVTGFFFGTVDFGGGPLTAMSSDVFVVKLDSAGNHLWSRGYGDFAGESAAGITCDDQGELVVTGSYGGMVDFGTGPLPIANGGDLFVTKLNP